MKTCDKKITRNVNCLPVTRAQYIEDTVYLLNPAAASISLNNTRQAILIIHFRIHIIDNFIRILNSISPTGNTDD